jgi:hypothetical protein
MIRRPSSPRHIPRERAWAIVWLSMLALLPTACSSASFVSTITFVNPTDFPAHVEVSDASRQGWLDLTIAQRGEETVVDEVADQGDVWVFRFEYVGRHQEELEMSRAELADAGWKVVVPQSFEDSLRRLDVEPPP